MRLSAKSDSINKVQVLFTLSAVKEAGQASEAMPFVIWKAHMDSLPRLSKLEILRKKGLYSLDKQPFFVYNIEVLLSIHCFSPLIHLSLNQIQGVSHGGAE
jgi:hypothetical protein